MTSPTLARLVRQHLRAYLAGAALLALFQVVLNRLDWLTKAAIDDFGSDSTRIALTMIALAGVAFVTRIAGRTWVLGVGHDVEYELRGRLLQRLHQLGVSFYRTMPTGEIMSRVTGDLSQVRIALAFGMVNVINLPFACASALQVMIRVHVGLTLLSLMLVPIMIVTTRAFSPKMFARTRAHQARLGELSAMVYTSLAGARILRAFAVEDGERARFDEANRKTRDASTALARLRSSIGPVYRAGALFGLLACFWYGSALMSRGPLQGGITRGEFFAFWMAFGRMAWPMVGIGLAMVTLERGRASLVRIRDILEAEPELRDGPLGEAPIVRGALSLRDVSFSYGERPVLQRISLEVGAGESLAVVGRAGSGKSTLAALIARLLPAQRGTIFVDGVDVCDRSLRETRRAVAYAQQEPFLFSTSIARNVAMGFSGLNGDGETRIRGALRDAHLLQEALAFSDGLGTVVGERGVRLSGGQKQRVALARALGRDAPILLFDDPVSAVDPKTEAAILAAVEQKAVGRTLILITNRIAAASRCARIVVLDDGRIVERGSHDELLARRGLYAALSEEQAAKSALAEAPS